MADFREATLRGQPEDKGLYFPAHIPQFDSHFLSDLRELSKADIAFEVIRPFVGGTIADDILARICAETVSFDFPLVPVSDTVSALELFHGPTLAFKDVGARFMSRCLGHFSNGDGRRTIVVVATSGDTGGAVAAGFHKVEGVEVVILYPKGKVSRVQELQLTTLGGNITAVEVEGMFDDCQALAKRALADSEIQRKAFLTSANSINVARWLPQQFYYLFALKQWNGGAPIFSVPSGNFGNICAGLLAHASGMPAGGFIAACNRNAVVPNFLRTGAYSPVPSVATLSNAMDVGDPSNFVRVLEIFGNEFAALKEHMFAQSVSDDETIQTIKEVHDDTGYILDPHGAVGYKALANHIESGVAKRGIFLETAHPIKFDSVTEIIGAAIPSPASAAALFGKRSESISIANDFESVKEIIVSKV